MVAVTIEAKDSIYGYRVRLCDFRTFIADGHINRQQANGHFYALRLCNTSIWHHASACWRLDSDLHLSRILFAEMGFSS